MQCTRNILLTYWSALVRKCCWITECNAIKLIFNFKSEKLTTSNMKWGQISQKNDEWPHYFTLCKNPFFFISRHWGTEHQPQFWSCLSQLIIWSAAQKSSYLFIYLYKIWLNIQMNCICFLDNEWHHSDCMPFAKRLLIFIERGWFEVTLPTLNISDSTQFSKIHPFTNA